MHRTPAVCTLVVGILIFSGSAMAESITISASGVITTGSTWINWGLLPPINAVVGDPFSVFVTITNTGVFHMGTLSWTVSGFSKTAPLFELIATTNPITNASQLSVVAMDSAGFVGFAIDFSPTTFADTSFTTALGNVDWSLATSGRFGWEDPGSSTTRGIIDLTTVHVAPEPSSLMLCAMGICGLGAYRRLRQRV